MEQSLTQNELKQKFAASLLRLGDPAKAAFATVSDVGQALQIAAQWIDDPIVKAEQDRLMNGEEARSFLPTKEQQAKDIYAIASNERTDTEERLKAHRLYAEIMGNIVKPDNNSAVNIITPGVMIVPMAPNLDEWEKRALDQQRKLTIDAVN